MIRLATMRYGILEPLRKPPAFFERSVAAHFYYKRAELRQQCAQWVAEAKAAASYESALEKNFQLARVAYTSRFDMEMAAAQGNRTSAECVAAGIVTSFESSPALRKLNVALHAAQARRQTWLGVDISAHNVFARGIAGMPKKSCADYAPDAIVGSDSSAPQGSGVPSYAALAAALDAACAELEVELAKCQPPTEL